MFLEPAFHDFDELTMCRNRLQMEILAMPTVMLPTDSCGEVANRLQSLPPSQQAACQRLSVEPVIDQAVSFLRTVVEIEAIDVCPDTLHANPRCSLTKASGTVLLNPVRAMTPGPTLDTGVPTASGIRRPSLYAR